MTEEGPAPEAATLRGRVGSALTRVGEDIEDSWGALLVAGVLAAAAVVGLLQPLAHWATRASGPVTQVLALTPAVLLTLAVLAFTHWAFLTSRRRPEDGRSYAVAVSTWALAVALGIQLFAVVTLVLGGQGVVGVRPVGLWEAERLYALQAAAGVPLLHVPETLGWAEPRLVLDHPGGLLVVAFKLVVLIPTVTLLLATFPFVLAERRRAEARTDQLHGFATDPLLSRWTRRSVAWDAAKALVLHLGWAGLGVLLVFLCSRVPSAPRDQLVEIAGRVPDRDPAGPVTAVAVALALAYGYGSYRTTRWVRENLDPYNGRWRRGGAGLMLRVAATCAAATSAVLLAAAVDLLATRSAPAVSAPDILNAYAWHVVNMVPSLDLPATLDWRTSVQFPAGSGWLLLAAKSAVLLALLTPVSVVVQSFAGRAAAPGGLTAVLEFEALIDRLERDVDALVGAGPGGWSDWLRCSGTIDDTDPDAVRHALGDEAYESAWRVLRAAKDWLNALMPPVSERDGSVGSDPVRAAATRQAFAQARTDFRQVAGSMLASAAWSLADPDLVTRRPGGPSGAAS